MRKLASIRKIDDIRPIVGADSIECAVIGGWTVVVKKGEFSAGDLAVYLEIDSWVPTELAPFLTKGKEPREFEGVKGERLRTVKLRGQLSQGLLLPRHTVLDKIGEICEGMDVTELLGILKWELPMNAQLAGLAKGNFPSQIPKTDQERVQNLVNEVDSAIVQKLKFEVTEKLEGSSMTVFKIDGVFGVCSRNLELKRDENNAFWKCAIANNIEEKIKNLPFDVAIQGELIGPGIQGNIYKLSKPEFFVFDCYHIGAGQYFTPYERRVFVDSLELNHVPVLDEEFSLGNVQTLLEYAEGASVLNVNQEREGVVFKEVFGGMTFKAISNKYLMKSEN